MNPRSFVQVSPCRSTILSVHVRYRGWREVLDRRPTDRQHIGMSICKISAITYVSCYVNHQISDRRLPTLKVSTDDKKVDIEIVHTKSYLEHCAIYIVTNHSLFFFVF